MAYYFFCFARPDPAPELDGAALEFHSFGGIGAVVSEVPLDEFCGPDAERNLQDLAWIAPRACRHEQVIEDVMRQSPVLPARFGTIFSTLDGLEDFVDRHRGQIAEALDRLAGHQEWGVKVWLEPAQAKEGALAREFAARQAQWAAASAGMRYLQQQRVRAEVEKSLGRVQRQICRAAAEELRAAASGFAERRALSEPAEGRECIGNWAFLLPLHALDSFRRVVDQTNAAYAPDGLSFKLAGPWPPYSFVPALDGEEPR